MLSASIRPSGARLVRDNPVKIRCVNLNSYNNFWDSFWNNMWSQSDLTTQINYYQSIGVNCVKIYADGMPSVGGGNGVVSGTGYASDAVTLARIQWLIAQIRAAGMKIYLAMNQSCEFASGTLATNLATEQKFLGWFTLYAPDLVVAVDLCNEMNKMGGYSDYTNATAVANMTALAQMARASCPFPLTASVYLNAKSDMGTNQWLDLQYNLGLDFHDYHPYYGFQTGVMPLGTDMALMENRALFLGRYLCGECGVGVDGDNGSPAGYQSAWVNGMGDMARRQHSFGSVWFCSRYYQENINGGQLISDYGIYPTTLINPNPAITGPLQNWPAAL